MLDTLALHRFEQSDKAGEAMAVLSPEPHMGSLDARLQIGELALIGRSTDKPMESPRA